MLVAQYRGLRADGGSFVLHAVSCTSATFCMAVGGSDKWGSESWDGSRWTPHQGGGRGVDGGAALSCATPTFCLDTPAGPVVSVWNGITWTVLQLPQSVVPGLGLQSVSCPSALFCAGVGAIAHAVTWDRHSWVAGPAIQPQLTQVSCGSPTTCLAITPPGSGYTDMSAVTAWDGAGWSQLVPVPADGKGVISCGSAESCTVQLAGETLQYNPVPCPTAQQVLYAWTRSPGMDTVAPGAPAPKFGTPQCWGNWVWAGGSVLGSGNYLFSLDDDLHGITPQDWEQLTLEVCSDPRRLRRTSRTVCQDSAERELLRQYLQGSAR